MSFLINEELRFGGKLHNVKYRHPCFDDLMFQSYYIKVELSVRLQILRMMTNFANICHHKYPYTLIYVVARLKQHEKHSWNIIGTCLYKPDDLFLFKSHLTSE